MADRRYPRPRSPPLQHPGRSSLPSFGYGSYTTDAYAPPIRGDVRATPRNGTHPIVASNYKMPPSRNDTASEPRRHRRSTLDATARPTIVNAQPRSPAIHDGAGRPQSPTYNPYRSSEEGGEYYTIPSSSGRRGHHRGSYSATMDNADMAKIARDGGGLTVGSGREGARYPIRSKPVYPGALVRRADTVADDYGDDGYGYTNARDLFEYDMQRGARYAPQRRDSYDGPRPARPLSVSGYPDTTPRSYDPRERGPPPTTRGFEKLASRAPGYGLEPIRVPPVEPPVRSPRREQFYESDSPRTYSSRRPVSIYQDRPRREDYYDPRDEERRERREKREHSKRYDEEQRGSTGRGERNDVNGYERKRDYDRNDEYNDRAERKPGREKSGSSKKEHERRHDDDRGDDYDDHKERKSGQDKLAAGISLAAAALGVGTAAKGSKHDDSDDDRDDKEKREESRRRRDGDEYRKRRDTRDYRGSVDLLGRDPRERNTAKDKRDVVGNDGLDSKERSSPKEDIPVDLSGRNPQEKILARNSQEAQERKENRKDKSDPATKDSSPSSRENSPLADEVTERQRSRKDRGTGGNAQFDPKNINDVRAIKEQLNKASAPPIPPKEPMGEGSYERREPNDDKNTRISTSSRDDRGRRKHSDSEDEIRPSTRVVSPPEETKKLEDNKPKGILRPPREKFPEDPVPIREGVAPLKDARKDGVPPDARWTKISRRMVNPEALDAGKERYEAREDFVIVLRVLTKEEIQAYAIATQQIRAARDQLDELKEIEQRDERRRRRRDRHERHKRERERQQRERGPLYEYDHEHRRHKKEKEKDSHSESDSTEDEEPLKLLEAPKSSKKLSFDGPLPPTAGKVPVDSSLREDPTRPGTYTGYTRNPPRRY